MRRMNPLNLLKKLLRLDTSTGMIPYYSVIEHKDLPGYVIKSGAQRVPEGSCMLGPTDAASNRIAFFYQRRRSPKNSNGRVD